MFGKKIKGNFAISLTLLTVILLFVLSVYQIISIPRQYQQFAHDYIEDVQQDVNDAVESDEMEYNIIELKNEYSFDTMVFKEGVLLYTSSNLLYDIEYADALYEGGYVYKGSYLTDDKQVWLIIYETDLSKFVNEVLMKNMLIFAIQAILMIVLLVIVLRRVLKPLTKLAQIISVLKNDSTLDSDEKLDEISAELVKASNQLKLKLYFSKQEEKEYERMYLRQLELLTEQKHHLSHIVHDVKGTFAAIKFSSQSISNIKGLNEREQTVLNSIEVSSKAALEYITESLNQVINNDMDIYIVRDNVEVKKLIEEFFEFNNMLLIEKNLKVKITGEEKTILTNVLKFEQIITNVLSNMIKYAKNNSELMIDLGDKSCVFTNYTDDVKKAYSNSFGLNSIKTLSNDIGLNYEYNFDDDLKTFVLYIGCDNNE